MKIQPATVGTTLLLSGLLLVSAGCNKSGDETAEGANASETTGGAMTRTDAGANAAAKTDDAMKGAGDKMQGAAGGVTDAGVTAKVKNAINMSTVIDHKTSKINVDTKPGEVILRGTVATAKEKAEAEKLAKANAGARKIVDQITVGPKK